MRSPLFGGAIFCFALLALSVPAVGQTPFIGDEEKFGRPEDASNLSYCIDKRDPAWEVDQQIAEAVASAMLLIPEVHVVEDTAPREELDRLYRHLLENCRLYFGFKLIPELYPDWLTITRAYYEVGYVFVTANPDWQRLGDIPRSEALGPSLASTADFRLVAYLNSQSEEGRWRRFPMPSDAAALQAVLDGTVAAALVWAPSFYALGKTDPAISGLRVIVSDPLPEERLPVGAVLLSGDAFLQNSVDQAIAALIADGTIASILDSTGLPAAVPRQ